MRASRRMSRRKSKKSRKSRSRRPSRRIARLPRKTQASVYRWDFHPDPQYISGSISGTPGIITISAGSPTAPIFSTLTGTPYPRQMAATAAVSGIPSSYDMGIAFSFALHDLTNYSAFTGMFDQYRLESVTVKVTSLNNMSNINTRGGLTSLYTVPDYDDCIPPTSVHQVRGRQGSKLIDLGVKRSHSFTLRPVRTMQVDEGAGTAFTNAGSVLLARKAWNDCAYTTNAHFAMKLWIQDFFAPGDATVVNTLKFDYTYRVAFKGAQNGY